MQLLPLLFCLQMNMKRWKNSCELVVYVQFVPEDCTEIAEIGDEVHVHYQVNIFSVCARDVKTICFWKSIIGCKKSTLCPEKSNPLNNVR